MQIQTKSGARVELSLVNQLTSGAPQGLAVEATVLGSVLTAQDQQALAAMAEGWEQAIAGLTQMPPRINLEALSQAGGAQIASLKLSAQAWDDNGKITLDVQYVQDANSRTIDMHRADGRVHIAIDTRQPALWGTSAQKDKVVAHYLKGLDSAARKGHADSALTELFGATFTAMSRIYGARESAAASKAPGSALWSAPDQALMTGLAERKPMPATWSNSMIWSLAAPTHCPTYRWPEAAPQPSCE